jgi:aspartate/tyrosine/aromatic aminotransferase
MLDDTKYFIYAFEEAPMNFSIISQKCGYVVCICYRQAAVERITHQLEVTVTSRYSSHMSKIVTASEI